jgi:hypothetical protein
MVIAMVAVRMMKVILHEVINVVAVRHLFMAAIRAVNVRLVMRSAVVLGGACIRIRGRHLQDMFIHMIAMLMVQMAIMQVIGVSLVIHGRVAAAALMFVIMSLVFLAFFWHAKYSRSSEWACDCYFDARRSV